MLETRDNLGQFEEQDLLREELSSIKKSTESALVNKAKFNHYADKMLYHLVVA